MVMLQRKPLISVIMATYNRAHLLLWPVNSVLNQTYKNIELIIVDDCSTDNTRDVVEALHLNEVDLLLCDEDEMPIDQNAESWWNWR